MRAAERCFVAHGWALPPNARWDIADFGLGVWRQFGLVLVNLAQEPEYCEKLMYAKGGIALLPEFYPLSQECILGEVSTANDDTHYNYFVKPNIGRYPGIEEDEVAIVWLVSEE